jgi:hypothetical protein
MQSACQSLFLLVERDFTPNSRAISAENPSNLNSFFRISSWSECTVARQSGSQCAGRAQRVQPHSE